MDLSVLIAARNEQFLLRTILDVFAHAEAETEVIAVLDGAWPAAPLPLLPRLQVVYLPESIGQRAAINVAARLSRATYIMKLDAHCSVAQGFDAELIRTAATLGPHVTQIPAQHNLHAFNWECVACHRTTYQGPTPTIACACGATDYVQAIVWERRRGVRTLAWRFDRELHFQYWGAFSQRPEGQGEVTETLSCLGACWFLDRAWYWALGGLDEAHGSWGQMGTEIACKAWLSGGRMVTNQRTWFAHMFRTQGGDFGFPFPVSGAQVARARQHSRALWVEGAAVTARPLSWLLDHFAPVPDWSAADVDALRQAEDARRAVVSPASASAGMAYYTDNRLEAPIADAVRARLATIGARLGLPIVAVSLAPLPAPFATAIVLTDTPRGTLAMFRQILAGLEALTTDVAFLVEHDVLYHPDHFAFRPARRDTYYYNQHVYKVDATSGRALHYRCSQTSGLCADRLLLIAHYRARVAQVTAAGFRRNNGFEPGTRSRAMGGFDDVPAATWFAAHPNVDVRHATNLTPSRWSKAEFRNQRYTAGWTESETVPGWGRTQGRFRDWLRDQADGPLPPEAP